MIERIVENWLIEANERLFQYPFCQILANKGHTVLHMTRHCAMEQGKDIISIDADGNICAFQLKGISSERMTLSKWEENITQINKLVYQSPIHPTIKESKPHKSFLVINSDLDEEVQSSINAYNQSLANQGRNDKLEVIVKGEFLEGLKLLGSDFWPIQPSNLNQFLELYLQNGKGFPDKEKLSLFISENFGMNALDKLKLSKNQARRLALSLSFFNSFLVTPFNKENNYASEFECYIIYLSHLIGFIEKQNLEYSFFEDLINLTLKHLYNLLINIAEELEKLEYYHTDYILEAESIVYRPRMTYLIALASLLYLWNYFLKDEDYIITKYDDFIKKFIKDNAKYIYYWGEYASPQMLLFYLFQRYTNGSGFIDFFLRDIINVFISQSKNKNSTFPDPYVDFDSYIKNVYDKKNDPQEKIFNRESYSIECFVHLFTMKNFKNEMRFLWPGVSRLQHNKFIFKNKWEFYKWKASEGSTVYEVLPLQKSWAELFKESNEHSGDDLPLIIKNNPIYFLCHILVYPHRLNSNGGRWLIKKLYSLR